MASPVTLGVSWSAGDTRAQTMARLRRFGLSVACVRLGAISTRHRTGQVRPDATGALLR